MQILIGVDVGSSGAKATAANARGAVVASSDTHGYPTHYPRPGWAEQNPEDWYITACTAIRQCVNQGSFTADAVAGVAIVGPAHNVALLDEEGAILGPTLHWSDLRSTFQSERLEAQCGARIFDVTYQRVNPSWTLSQLLWIKENAPSLWARLRRILVTKDYVRYRFTGEYATDPYDAIGLQLFDVADDGWSAEMCELIDFPVERLPPVQSAFAVAGTLVRAAAAATGLLAGTPVAVGSADVTVEAFGIGAVEPGAVIVKLGTAGCVNLVTAAPHPSEKSLTYRHVMDDRGFTITATNSGTGALRWFRDAFWPAERTGEAFAQIDEFARQAPPGCAGLLFHPYLRGERSPHWDARLRGDFVGIGAHHTFAHFARAVMEGVAFSLRDCLGAVKELGEPLTDFYLIGGGTRSALWQQIVCDVLGVALIKPAIEDAAFGAALLAGVAVDCYPNWRTALATCVTASTLLEPDGARHALYSNYFTLYQDVTRDLAVYSHRLADLAAEI